MVDRTMRAMGLYSFTDTEIIPLKSWWASQDFTNGIRFTRSSILRKEICVIGLSKK